MVKNKHEKGKNLLGRQNNFLIYNNCQNVAAMNL